MSVEHVDVLSNVMLLEIFVNGIMDILHVIVLIVRYRILIQILQRYIKDLEFSR